MRPKTQSPTSVIPKKILESTNYMAYLMQRQGLNIAYPDDVNGWKWGKAFIIPSQMAERMQFHGLMIWEAKDSVGAAATSTHGLMMAANPQNSAEMTNRFCEIMDFNLREEQKLKLTQFFDTQGGPKCLKDSRTWRGPLYWGLRLTAAMPERHVV
jgi:hypothetical protein